MDEKYLVFKMKCVHCDYVDTLDNSVEELVQGGGSPLFIGLQCESFFNHLEVEHGICLQPVGVGTTSECLFGFDSDTLHHVDDLMIFYGGLNLNEHFVTI